jgi:hypothetical protein
MNERTGPKVDHVRGPDGRPLTLADLPSPATKRWVMRRKAEVVAAVRGGLLSLEEAGRRYKLSHQELLSWQICVDQYGLAGLRTTRTQYYARSVRSSVRFGHYQIGGRALTRLPKMPQWTRRSVSELA